MMKKMAKTEVTFNPIFYESDRKQNKKKALRHLKKQKREKERGRKTRIEKFYKKKSVEYFGFLY